MTDRPIPFKAPEVQALLGGRKRQTRRVAKVRKGLTLDNLINAGQQRQVGPVTEYHAKREHLAEPAYAVGDRLWVRETWCHTGDHVFEIHQARMQGPGGVIFAADSNPEFPHAKWWPSIHMPREFSRITLTVTDVRVERLQDISSHDCIGEGVTIDPAILISGLSGHCPLQQRRHYHETHVEAFRTLWTSINGSGSWEANPWVVALTFDVALRNIDEVTL